MVTCNDLLLGGSLSSAGISGGMSINDTSISVNDWSTLFGAVGQTGVLAAVYGRPGVYVAGDRLPKDRLLALSVTVHRRSIEDCSPADLALMENTDRFLSVLAQRGGTYLEVVMPDGSTRFIHVVSLDPGPMRQPAATRVFTSPLVAPWGNWWEGGAESSEAISGADSLVVGGNQIVYDALLTFAGDGTFTHDDLGWEIEITGSTGIVTVDLGNRLVTEGGVPAMQLMRRTPVPGEGRVWGWFLEGINNVTSTVGVTVTWRNQWL